MVKKDCYTLIQMIKILTSVSYVGILKFFYIKQFGYESYDTISWCHECFLKNKKGRRGEARKGAVVGVMRKAMI